jgi:hypothetical protein
MDLVEKFLSDFFSQPDTSSRVLSVGNDKGGRMFLDESGEVLG